jgi:hypothetical protein
MRRIMKLTVLPLACVATACLADGGVDRTSGDDAGPTTRESRDLTLATPRDDGASAVSPLERGRTEAPEARTASVAAPEEVEGSTGEVVIETYAYVLEPAAAALPEVLRVRTANGSLGAALAKAPVGASALPTGFTVGVPTPASIEFTRPSEVSEYEPYEYASLAGAFAPSGGGILGGIRGGSCGPRGGL